MSVGGAKRTDCLLYKAAAERNDSYHLPFMFLTETKSDYISREGVRKREKAKEVKRQKKVK